ncbi:MAG TPA: DMT family transporter [Methylomirabilota bacterium]|nr:DMT family transporter [Methylomirabilota bacterium]
MAASAPGWARPRSTPTSCGPSWPRSPRGRGSPRGSSGSALSSPSTVRPGSDRLARVAPYVFILLWSSSFITARVGLRSVSPLLFVAVRLVAAGALLGVAVARSRPAREALRGRWHQLAMGGALVNGLTLSAFHVGMVTENIAVMALIQSLSPMLIALAAVPLLGERLRPGQWLGLGLGTVGVALVIAPRALDGPAGWRAIALGFLGVAGLAGGTLYFRRACADVPLLPATAVQVAAGAVLTVALMLGFEQPHAVWTPPAVAAVVWNVAAVSIGAMALYYYMLAHGTAGRVAANFYLVPVTVALVGWAFLDESLTRLAVVGFVVASAGVFLVARPARERPA